MRLDRFDLNLLVLFEAVYEEGNFTRAAERLNVAQPTVSNAIRRLREAFDDPLFVRSGHGVAPTPLAMRLIAPVRQSLRQMQAALDGNMTFDPALSDRTFRISVGEVQANLVLPNLARALRDQAPGVKVHAFQSDRREIKEGLATGALDLAIDIPRLSSAQLSRSPLMLGDYVCALRKGHPGARGKLTVERFAALDFVTVSSRQTGSTLLELALNRVGVRVEPALRTQYYLPALRTVEISDYALVVPRSMTAQFAVTVKELPFELDIEGAFLYWHRSAEGDPANGWLRGLVSQACGFP